MWIEADMNQVAVDAAIISQKLISISIAEQNGSEIDINNPISIPLNVGDNLELYSAACEIISMCSKEYNSETCNTCNHYAYDTATIHTVLKCQDLLNRAVAEHDMFNVMEKGVILATYVLQKKNNNN